MHLADVLSKATYSAFRLYICIVSMLYVGYMMQRLYAMRLLLYRV